MFPDIEWLVEYLESRFLYADYLWLDKYIKKEFIKRVAKEIHNMVMMEVDSK